jgi:hypothetical protein
MKPAIERIDVKTDELKQALERSRQAPLEDPDYRKLEAAVNTLDYLTELVADKDTTIRHLRQLLLGSSTEKTRDVLQRAGVEPASAMKPEDVEAQTEGDAQPGRTQWGRGVSWRQESRYCTPDVGARRSLFGVRARQRIQAEGAEGAGADCGTSAAGGHRLLAGAITLRRLRAGVHSARAGRSRSGKIRRDGGGHDRAA